MTESIDEEESRPGLVAHRDGEGAYGHEEPYLPHASPQVGGAPCLEGVGQCRVVGVNDHIDARADIRSESLDCHDEVEGLKLVDVGVCLGERWGGRSWRSSSPPSRTHPHQAGATLDDPLIPPRPCRPANILHMNLWAAGM